MLLQFISWSLVHKENGIADVPVILIRTSIFALQAEFLDF
jgi:hypothetical protein